MTDFPTSTFDLAGLQSSLCTIEGCFLCTRWDRDRPGNPESLPASALSHHEILTHDPSWVDPYITTAMLRANNVPWRVSAAQPAILPFFTNIWAGVQDLTIQSVTSSDPVDNIHCMFCLDEEGDQVDERVILRCVECRSLSHLACTEEWLKKRRRGRDSSCCICPTKTALDALYRPPRGPRWEPQNAPKKPSRRFITTHPLIWTPCSHGPVENIGGSGSAWFRIRSSVGHLTGVIDQVEMDPIFFKSR